MTSNSSAQNEFTLTQFTSCVVSSSKLRGQKVAKADISALTPLSENTSSLLPRLPPPPPLPHTLPRSQRNASHVRRRHDLDPAPIAPASRRLVFPSNRRLLVTTLPHPSPPPSTRGHPNPALPRTPRLDSPAPIPTHHHPRPSPPPSPDSPSRLPRTHPDLLPTDPNPALPTPRPIRTHPHLLPTHSTHSVPTQPASHPLFAPSFHPSHLVSALHITSSSCFSSFPSHASPDFSVLSVLSVLRVVFAQSPCFPYDFLLPSDVPRNVYHCGQHIISALMR